jgi:hypothetical protein
VFLRLETATRRDAVLRSTWVVSMTAALVAAVPAAAQAPEPDLSSKLRIRPEKAGSKHTPQGVRASGRFEVTSESGPLPVLIRGHVLVPRGIAFNGQDYASCSKRTLVDRGPRGCPRGSIVGQASSGFDEDLGTHPSVVFVNGGPHRIWAYTTLYRPALVKEPVGIAVKRLESRRWAYELSFVVPSELRVVAGVPLSVPASLSFSIGGKAYAQRYFAVDRPCPRRGYRPYRIRFTLLDGDDTRTDVEDRGRIACQ